MRSFEALFDIAAERKGGADALTEQIPASKSAEELAQIPDDRWLATFTKYVFSAGFNWRVIEAKWDGFEAAFHGFDIGRCAMMDDDWFDALLKDPSIVRNGAKIRSIQENAVFLSGLNGAGKVIGEWPATDYASLLEMLKKKGTRLGGTSTQYALRVMGRDGFILSNDVVARLIAEGVIEKPPSSKTAMRAVQAAFNTWMEQSGKGLTEISRVLAMSL